MYCVYFLSPVISQLHPPVAKTGLFVASLFLWTLLTAAPVAAEVPAPRFVHITQEQGLSSNTVLAIAEDRRGFMWLGTDDGLNRFDGHEFTIYRPQEDDPLSLSHGRIQALLVDREGVLWVGTSRGLDRYDPNTDSFEHILVTVEGMTGRPAQVHSLHQDHAGRLWVGLEEGLGRFDPEGQAVHQHYLQSDLPRVTAIQGDRSGRLWIGGDGSGLEVFNPQTKRFEAKQRVTDVADSLDQEIRAFLEDSDGDLWIGSRGGLDRYDPQSDRFTRLRHDPVDSQSLSSPYVDAILEDRTGLLWVGTNSGGLSLVDRRTLTITQVPHVARDPSALSSHVVRSLYEDSRGDIWVGTYQGGVSFFNVTSRAFTHVQSQPGEDPILTSDQILSFFGDHDGHLWVGTEDGLNLLDPTGRPVASWRHDPLDPGSLSAQAVLTVTRDSQGHLWAGTFFGGLNQLLPEPGEGGARFRHYRPEPENPASLSNPHVWDVFEDSAGELWVATFGGLDRFDRPSGDFEHFRHDPEDAASLVHDQVWQVYEDSGNTLWLATAGGVSALDRETRRFRNYALEVNVLTLIETKGHAADDRALWLGTEGYGLRRLDPDSGEQTIFTTGSGLANDLVTTLLEDDEGFLWLGTNAGVSKFDPNTSAFINFAKSDGILALPFSKGAAMWTRGDDILMGGRHGLLRFDPSEVPETVQAPSVVLTEFAVLNDEVEIGGPVIDRHITQAQNISLRYDQSTITLTYAALNFRSPEDTRYAYRLDPFDDDWNEVGARRSATYTNLDPGDYVFRVKAFEDTEALAAGQASIQVTVAPPYWMTWWFRLSMLIVIAGILLGIHQYKTGNIRALLGQLAQKNAALEEQMEEIERFAYATSHELTSPLVTIKNYLGAVEQDARRGRTDRIVDDLGRVSRAAESMERRLTKLSEYLEQSREAGRRRQRLAVSLEPLVQQAVERVASRIAQQGVEVHIQPGIPSVEADPNLLAAVLDVLIDNALKYMGDTPKPTIEIGAEEDGAEVRSWVRDRGIGIDPRYQERIFQLFERLDPGDEGIGLDLPKARKIIEWHGGRLWAESDGPGQGSTFFFTLPHHISPRE